jgi:hypothetical protein
MKLYLLMLVLAVMVLLSGCTQTGEVITTAQEDAVNDTENETGHAGAGTGPEDPCEGAVCGETITTCPDGFVSACTNPCDPRTGECLPCRPDCSGHEEAGVTAGGGGCGIWCDPAECRVLDEARCECETALFCDGNGICEHGEYPDSEDCPECDDGDPCTQDYYDFELGSCVCDAISPCIICGNLECEEGETGENCPEDCLEEQEGDVRITALNETEEWVEFEGYNVIMTDWTLSDWKENYVYTFPVFMIDGKVKLHKGEGEDNETDLFWQKKMNVWNNDGDNATLRDENGEIVDFYNYT